MMLHDPQSGSPFEPFGFRETVSMWPCKGIKEWYMTVLGKMHETAHARVRGKSPREHFGFFNG